MTPIQELKIRTGLGFVRLARLLGAHPSTIRNWLRGQAPSAIRQAQIQDYLAMDPETLATLANLTRQRRKDGTP